MGRRRQSGSVHVALATAALAVCVALSVALAVATSSRRFHPPTAVPLDQTATPPENRRHPAAWPDTAVVSRIVVARDRAGRQASVQFVVLSKDHVWEFESVSRVLALTPETAQDFPAYLRQPAMTKALGQYLGVMVVGAASAEGGDRQPRVEEDRARDRARILRGWLQIPPRAEVHELTLGYYNGSDAERSSNEQRYAVIIGIVRRDPGIDWEAAVLDALHNAPREFPMPVYSYSRPRVRQVR